jgi:DNA-directed RNA polymerase subunit RPC12/RpoP
MAKLMEYKCPCCGGAIEFDSSIQKMKCPYCDTEFEMETLKELDEELSKEKPDDMEWDTDSQGEWSAGETQGMSVYVCKSCGGEIVADESTAATSCPFCGNPVVMQGKFAGGLRPDYIIPFKLDKKAAKEGLIKHMNGKRLLPKIFKSENHIDEIKGVYVPFWLFDSDVEANLRYRATRVRAWSDAHYDYVETRFYSIFRSGELGFNQIPVDGSTKIDNDLTESLEPYNKKDAVDFQTAYMAGYFADKYDVSAEDSIERANERVRKSTEDAFASTVQGYTTVVPENTNIRLHQGQTKYALYPVWLLSTSWKGENYLFAMNGQTGKFVGNLPVDKSALMKWRLGLTAVFSIIVYLIIYLIHMMI